MRTSPDSFALTPERDRDLERLGVDLDRGAAREDVSMCGFSLRPWPGEAGARAACYGGASIQKARRTSAVGVAAVLSAAGLEAKPATMASRDRFARLSRASLNGPTMRPRRDDDLT